MKRLLLAGSIALGFAVCTGCLPGDFFYLPVDLYPQEQPSWCWAASAEMAMAYIRGPRIRQCTQVEASYGFAAGTCCQQPTACDYTGWPQFQNYSFCSKDTLFPLTQDQVREQLNTRKTPFVFALATGDGGTHMWVARGYKTVLVPQVDTALAIHTADSLTLAGSTGDKLMSPYELKPTIALKLLIYVNDPAPIDTGSIYFMSYDVYSSQQLGSAHQRTIYNLADDQGQPAGCSQP